MAPMAKPANELDQRVAEMRRIRWKSVTSATAIWLGRGRM